MIASITKIRSLFERPGCRRYEPQLTAMLAVVGYNVEAYPSAEELLQSPDARQVGGMSPLADPPFTNGRRA